MLNKGEEPDEPEVWGAGRDLLTMFWTLDRTRQRFATSVSVEFNPLTPSDIATWASWTGQDLQPWEFETLMAMDRARMAGGKEAESVAHNERSGMNAEVFDALFG